jgi:hypothetical protein
MQRSDGPAIRDTASGSAPGGARRGLASISGARGWRPVLPRLWRALRLGLRQPLARMRPWHGLQDALDERCGLSDRLLHDHAQSGDLALEPCPPPHRHVIVGRDPEIAVMRPPDLLRVVLNFFGILDAWHSMIDCCATPPASSAPKKRPSFPRWNSPRPSARPDLAGDLYRDDCQSRSHGFVAAADADRPAAPLRCWHHV